MKAGIQVALMGLMLFGSGDAAARGKKVFTYRYNIIWSTTVRLLRADRGYKVTDRDKETGYVLFVYPGRGSVKACKASLEIIKVVDRDGYERIRVQLKIAHQPSYVEVAVLDALEQKLQEEQGSAPPPRKVRETKRDKKQPSEPRKPGDKKEKGKDR